MDLLIVVGHRSQVLSLLYRVCHRVAVEDVRCTWQTVWYYHQNWKQLQLYSPMRSQQIRETSYMSATPILPVPEVTTVIIAREKPRDLYEHRGRDYSSNISNRSNGYYAYQRGPAGGVWVSSYVMR